MYTPSRTAVRAENQMWLKLLPGSQMERLFQPSIMQRAPYGGGGGGQRAFCAHKALRIVDIARRKRHRALRRDAARAGDMLRCVGIAQGLAAGVDAQGAYRLNQAAVIVQGACLQAGQLTGGDGAVGVVQRLAMGLDAGVFARRDAACLRVPRKRSKIDCKLEASCEI